jgi:hypothetical protein
MRRWLVTISLTIAILSNTVSSVQCTPSGIDSNLPDCCKDGMCPHHVSGQESQSCPHTLSPGSTLALMVLSAMPATIHEGLVEPIQLAPAGAAIELLTPNVIQPILLPFTPPPEL